MTTTIDMDLFEIKPLKTDKSNIKQKPAVEAGLLQKIPHAAIFQGCSGSGKTVLLLNLAKKDIYYKDAWADITILTGSYDDLYDQLDVKEENIHRDPKQWDSIIGQMFEEGYAEVKEKGASKTKQRLVIVEDIISYEKFLRRSENFRRLFYMGRHANITTWVTSQSWTGLPKKTRSNANVIYFFQGNRAEHDMLADQFCPSTMNRKLFYGMMDHAVKDDHSFLTIFPKNGMTGKFRRKLTHQLIPESL
jgi:hypothetical protein